MAGKVYERWKEDCNRVFEDAKARLYVADVWDLAPYQHEGAPTRDGMFWSPFRPQGDGKTFSVSKQGRVFKDFARDECKGDVVSFIRLCWPDREFKEIRREVLRRAGLQEPSFPRDEVAAEKKQDPKERIREERENRLQWERDQKVKRKKFERDVARRRELPGHRAVRHAWPSEVEGRWRDGVAWAGGRPDLMEKLCARRGWPEEWAYALGDLGKLSFPVLPWQDADWEHAKHFVAFLVEALDPHQGDRLVPVGYHQKFYEPKEGIKGFVFVPYAPDTRGKVRSDLQRACVAWAQAEKLGRYDERGQWRAVDKAGEVAPGDAPALTPPLPFVLGDVADPAGVDLVVVMEGQWDALTLWGAMGYLHPDGLDCGLNTVIFGVRGATNWPVFLSYWRTWLRGYSGRVLMVPDPDAAGQRWIEPAADRNEPPEPTFMEMLQRLGLHVVGQSPKLGGPDFNDTFKSWQPDVSTVMRWLRQIDVLRK
jgi:hypothetical protein